MASGTARGFVDGLAPGLGVNGLALRLLSGESESDEHGSARNAVPPPVGLTDLLAALRASGEAVLFRLLLGDDTRAPGVSSGAGLARGRSVVGLEVDMSCSF